MPINFRHSRVKRLLSMSCHTALKFGVKAKENQDNVPTLYWLPNLRIKQDLLAILVLV